VELALVERVAGFEKMLHGWGVDGMGSGRSPGSAHRLENALQDTGAGQAFGKGFVVEADSVQDDILSEGEKVLAEARERFPHLQAICVHRSGLLEIGDCAVWVGVASAHRDEAFKACRYIIDQIKVRLPIWKKEHYVDGDSGWVNCERCANV
jgi:hypothetical protein